MYHLSKGNTLNFSSCHGYENYLNIAHQNNLMADNVTVVEQQGRFEALLVKVQFSDCRKRVLYVTDSNPPMSSILSTICDKEGFNAQVKRLFALWICNGLLDLRLRPGQNLQDAIKCWPKWLEKFGNEMNAESFSLVFKRDALVTVEKEKFIQDEAVIKLLYAEAAKFVTEGKYPTTLNEALLLAGLELHILYGDYNAEKHTKEFVMESMEELISSFHRRASKQDDLAQKLIIEYKKHCGLTAKKAIMLYLSFVRKWPCYGSIFYPACKTAPPGGIFANRHEKILIGVNMKGIHVVDIDKNVIIPLTLEIRTI